MKNYLRFKAGALPILFASFLVSVLSCTETPVADSPVDTEITLKSSADEIGKTFYEHIKNHALEDVMSTANTTTLRADVTKFNSLAVKFDSLKASKNVSYEKILNEAVSRKQISANAKDMLLTFDSMLLANVRESQNLEECMAWCSEQDDKVFGQDDLTIAEKRLILDHQAILKYYIRYTFETNPELNGDPAARTQGAQSILCYISCAVGNIGAFSGVGALAGGVGSYVGAAVGLIYTVVNSESCGCGGSTPPTCKGATSVSAPDVCYSSFDGLLYTAWGYGVTPTQFIWNFHRDDLSNPAIVRDTYSDYYRLTHSEINGATKVAVRVTSLCPPGNYLYSQYLWTSPLDNGKPRPVIVVTELPGNYVQYSLSGTNISSFSWFAVPSYRGTVVESGTNYIVVDWIPDMRVGVSLTATSSCGTAFASAY